jgi:hypothetical protein
MNFQTADSRGFPLASALAAFAAGILTAFTVSIGGELPLGEVILILVFGWVTFHGVVTGSLPPEIPRTRLFRILLVCQAVAFAAYVFSDLYRHSSVHDMGRGWARMVFLAIDIVAVAYLLGCSPLNLLMFLAGQLMGDTLHSFAFGALYGDVWKFGIGVPITYLVLFLAALLGRPALVAAAFAMGGVHLVMDYRSFGGICFAVGIATLLTLFPRRTRTWLAIPAFLLAAIAVGGYAYKHHGDHRATRSNVSRSAMLIAAYQGFMSSPIIGQGSWFSNSPVFDNFMQIRADAAKVAGVGGFPEANEDPGTVAFHSQILVALAEGGIFGATFFLAFGAALVVAICKLTFTGDGGRYTGLYLLILISALFNWMLSPFSGAHRVYIAVACGLLVLLQRQRTVAAARTLA